MMMTAALWAQSGTNVIDEVIWVVGDEAIYKSEVENARIDAQMQGQRFDGDPYCIIPENLAIQKLFIHQAAIDSVEVTDTEVWMRVDRTVERYVQILGSAEKLEQYTEKTMAQFREQQFEMIKNQLLMQEVQRSLVKNVKVSPAQVRNYFSNVPEDSIPFVPTTYEVQIMTRAPQVTQEEIDRVKGELRNYTERINAGTSSFSTLAVLYSEDKLSAVHGGELGFMGRSELVPEFANVAFNLTDPKAISKIVETEYGFHIIQLIEKRGDKVNVRHILLKPRATDEAIESCVNFLDSVSNEIRRGEYSFEDCVPYLSHDKNTRNNYGMVVYRDPETWETTTKIQLVNLPTEVARKVSSMNIGELSAPFLMTDEDGREVVAVVKLKNKTNGHRATMKDDYPVLRDVLIDKLNEEKIEQWIKAKQKTTYIRINEGWRNCEFQYPGWVEQ
ncbi:MAG: peptidylprolyl isomerase [Bacteroidaceae bacterium]|nr:peptidylprolyl isomerase [Bacteroidaceae bacterium]